MFGKAGGGRNGDARRCGPLTVIHSLPCSSFLPHVIPENTLHPPRPTIIDAQPIRILPSQRGQRGLPKRSERAHDQYRSAGLELFEPGIGELRRLDGLAEGPNGQADGGCGSQTDVGRELGGGRDGELGLGVGRSARPKRNRTLRQQGTSGAVTPSQPLLRNESPKPPARQIRGLETEIERHFEANEG
jgi:hypothetical protein